MEAFTMFMPKLLFLSLCAVSLAQAETGPNLGQKAGAEEIARKDINVFPNGQGLPKGRGNALEGKPLYQNKCSQCHGPKGIGASAEELAGRQHALTDPNPDKTIGNYWPYATTIFDFVRRSMPLHAPGSLSDSEVYAITAYLLNINDIIAEQTELNESNLAQIKMPNRDGFIGVDAR